MKKSIIIVLAVSFVLFAGNMIACAEQAFPFVAVPTIGLSIDASNNLGVSAQSYGGTQTGQIQAKLSNFAKLTRGSQILSVSYSYQGMIARKGRLVVKKLQEMGWKEESLKDGSCMHYVPSLILEMDEYGYFLTRQGGRVEKIPLKFTATAKEIAKQINGISASSGGVIIGNQVSE